MEPTCSLRVLETTSQRARGHRVQEYAVEVEGMDPANTGLRIAHLTDIHVGMLTPRAKILRAIRAANESGADLTVLTGDYVCYHPKHVPTLELVARELRGPAVAVLGNHDYWTDGDGVRRALERAGVSVLRNQHTTLEVRGVPLEVVGIDDAITRHHDPVKSFRGTRAGRTRVVLTHAPSMVEHASRHGRALVLAGHTHGGQVHVRGLSDRLWARVGHRYLKGFYSIGDALLYVNSGVGSSSVPVRAGAPSEVAIFTLRAA